MLGVRVLEDTLCCDISFSAERRESDDIGRKFALYVLSPIQRIFVGYSGQGSCEKKGFHRHVRIVFDVCCAVLTTKAISRMCNGESQIYNCPGAKTACQTA